MFTHPFSALRVGGPTFKTGEQMNATPFETSAIQRFLLSAHNLYDEYDSGDKPQQGWIREAVKSLQTNAQVAIAPLLEFSNNQDQHFKLELSDWINALTEVTSLLFDGQDTVAAEVEFSLLSEAIHTAIKPETKPALNDPRTIVRSCRRTLESLYIDLMTVLDFRTDTEHPPNRLQRMEALLYRRIDRNFVTLQELMTMRADKWISPRLGLNEDEWFTRIMRILYEIRDVLQNEYAQPYPLPLPAPNASRLKTLSDKIRGFDRDLQTLRFDSAQWDDADKPNVCRLRVDMDACQVWLDDQPFRVHLRSAIYLQAILENETQIPRSPISGSAIQERYPEFPQNKVSEYRKKLPPEIRELIDTSGNGSYLKPAAYTNPNLPDATR